MAEAAGWDKRKCLEQTALWAVSCEGPLGGNLSLSRNPSPRLDLRMPQGLTHREVGRDGGGASGLWDEMDSVVQTQATDEEALNTQ